MRSREEGASQSEDRQSAASRARVLFDRLTAPSPLVVGDSERRTAQFLSTVLLILAPLGVIAALLQIGEGAGNGPELAILIACVAIVATYVLSRTQYSRVARAITALIPTVGGLSVLASDSSDPGWFAFMVLNPALGTLLLPLRWATVLAVVNQLAIVGAVIVVDGIDDQVVVVALMFNAMVSAVLITAAWFRNTLEASRRRQLLEQQRRQQQRDEALFRAQRMESVGRLAAGLAHDTNNHLMVLSAVADILEHEHRAAKLPVDNVAKVRRAAHDIATLIRRVTVYGRSDETTPSPIDLTTFLLSNEALWRQALGRGIELRLTAETDAAGAGTVEIDQAGLEQLVLNLVLNARDAIGRRGAVSVSVATLDASSVRGRGEVAAGTYQAIIVRDTGSGIPADQLPHIFEPFYTTRDDGLGTGLGLFTAREIARSAGGEIVVDTGRDGSTFTVLLPDVCGDSRGA